MIEKRSHCGRWYYTPLGAAKAPTLWERISDWLDDLFAPLLVEQEGRRRIDPEEVYGYWSNGFYPPALPDRRKNAR